MIRFLAVGIFSLFVAACAAPNSSGSIAEFLKWQSSTRAAAEQGTVKFSDYYVEMYDRLDKLPSGGERNVLQNASAKLIPIARKYESGAMTRTEFDDIRRITDTQVRKELEDVASNRAAAIGQAMRSNEPIRCTTFGNSTTCR